MPFESAGAATKAIVPPAPGANCTVAPAVRVPRSARVSVAEPVPEPLATILAAPAVGVSVPVVSVLAALFSPRKRSVPAAALENVSTPKTSGRRSGRRAWSCR